MRLSIKKFAQGAAAITLFLFYGTLIVVWGNQSDGNLLLRSTRIEKVPTIKRSDDLSDLKSDHNYGTSFQERAPRSVIISKSEQLNNYSQLDDDINVEDNVVDNEKPISAINLAKTKELKKYYDLTKNSVKLKSKLRYGTQSTDPHSKTTIKDIFISVKTTKNFHKTRLDVILRTWYVLAKEQTYFFSDFDDPELNSQTNGHIINTNCSSSHNRKALCCKMSVEFDTFFESNKKWFCHFDDDNYVNVPRLVKLLQKYNPLDDWYLGKPSIKAPLEILSRDSSQVAFWFATGGAGFCLSRGLALKMMPLASGGKFISIGEKIRLPDDVTVGYIIEHLLGKKLTVIEQFHSHLEPMKFLKMDTLADQISFSYSRYGHEMNVVTIEDGINPSMDPTRFLSLHCHLFPHFNFCPR